LGVFALYLRNIALPGIIDRLFGMKQSRPSTIVLRLDTTVLDNDDAKKRHGVNPACKKAKGFQTLQLTWVGMW
jgi:hypothetical protein